MHHLMNKKERTNEEIIRTFQKIFTCHLKKVRKIFTELQSLIRFIQMRGRTGKKVPNLLYLKLKRKEQQSRKKS